MYSNIGLRSYTISIETPSNNISIDIIPLASMREGGRGPQRTMAQLEKGLPALYGLKLVLDLLLE